MPRMGESWDWEGAWHWYQDSIKAYVQDRYVSWLRENLGIYLNCPKCSSSPLISIGFNHKSSGITNGLLSFNTDRTLETDFLVCPSVYGLFSARYFFKPHKSWKLSEDIKDYAKDPFMNLRAIPELTYLGLLSVSLTNPLFDQKDTYSTTAQQDRLVDLLRKNHADDRELLDFALKHFRYYFRI
jgi:hypothetical protein